MDIPEFYTKAVFDFLDHAKPGESFLISRLAKKCSTDRFIDAVKLYIQSRDWDGGIEFNSDYTKIRKFEVP